MNQENSTTEQVRPRWFIDLDWHEQNHRSFPALAQRCLCPKCRERWAGETAPAELISTVKNCCSKSPDFVTARMPILETIFRLFLANGNQPLDVEELGKQLNERRSGDVSRTSPEILLHLLNSDRYYGLQTVKD